MLATFVDMTDARRASLRHALAGKLCVAASGLRLLKSLVWNYYADG